MTEKKERQRFSKEENLIQIIKFSLFSVSAGVIEAGSFSLLTNLTDWSYWPRYLIALTLSVVWNFTLNREFTFKSANNVPLAMLLIALFYAVFTPVTTIGGQLLSNLGLNEYLILGGTMALNLSTEFLYDRFVVYRGSINTNERAKREKIING